MLVSRAVPISAKGSANYESLCSSITSQVI